MDNPDPKVRVPEKKAGEQEPLYVTEHVVAGDFDFPASFRVEDLPGLLFYQIIVKGPQERRVVAWWKSKESFYDAWKDSYAKHLQSEGSPIFEGYQLRHNAKRDRIWMMRPAVLLTFLAGFVAVVSQIAVVRDLLYSLFDTPKCTFWVDPNQHIYPRSVGQEFPLSVLITNHNLHTSSTVTVIEIEHPPSVIISASKDVLADPGATSDSSPGSDSRKSGSAPKCRTTLNVGRVVQPGVTDAVELRVTGMDPGDHELTITGTQEAGRFRAAIPVPRYHLSEKLHIWAGVDHSGGKVTVIAPVSKDAPWDARVLVELQNASATPKGVRIDVILAAPGEIEMDYGRSVQGGDAPLRNDDFTKLHWTTPGENNDLKGYKFQLVLRGAPTKIPRSQEEWKAIVDERLIIAVALPSEMIVGDAADVQPLAQVATAQRTFRGKVSAIEQIDAARLGMVSAVTVKALSGGKLIGRALTNKSGAFQLSVPKNLAGEVEIRFEKVGYYVVPPRLVIPAGSPVSVSLEPEPIEPDLVIINDEFGRSPSSYAFSDALRARMESAGAARNARLGMDLIALKEAGVNSDTLDSVRKRLDPESVQPTER